MTWDDIAELLAFAAVFDQRRADELDIKAWLAVAQAQRWSPPAAQRVVAEHYSVGADRPRVTPAAITDRLRSLRSHAAESFEAPQIPAGLENRDYPPWLRAQLADHVDLLVDAWAATGVEPARGLPAVAPATVRSLPELVAAAPEHLRETLAAGVRRIQARRVRLDPDQRAVARAELDARREPKP